MSGLSLAPIALSTAALATALLLSSCGDDAPVTPTSSGSSGTGDGTTDGSTGDPATTTSASTSTTDPDTTGVDSTGPVAECGNGMIEGPEECDDGNLVEDDTCYSNCTIPYEALWTSTYDGGEDDYASDAVFDAEGNLYVLGTSEVDGQDYELWLRQYTPDGREGWTWTYGGDTGGDDRGSDLAWHGSGDLLLVGNETTDNGNDVLVIRFDLRAQSAVWIDRYDGTSTGPELVDESDFATDVAVDPDGNVLVSGIVREDLQQYDAWLRKYDADGNELWTQSYHGGFGNDRAHAVLVDANGDVYLAGEILTETGFEGWVRKHDADGNELWTNTLPGVNVADGTLDPEGNLVLVGYDVDNPANVNIWAGKFDPDFAPLGSTEYDGPSGAFDGGRGVTVDAAGDVYLAGSVTVIGQLENIWVGRYDSNVGLRWWSDSYSNDEANLADVARAVAVSDDGSRVALVGSESVIFQDRNVWVRMYQNNPTPVSR